MYYRNLCELLKNDSISRRYYQLLSAETQVTLQKQQDCIHTESDLRNTVNYLQSHRDRHAQV